MNKYLCIHGHFYQPPRTNPWTGIIEEQKSAHPHHDWNERIAHECYTPNTHTQILNNQNQAFKIVNNFAQISFNVGPTLLSWLERSVPDTYTAILDADRAGARRFSGHGTAIAQVYNHMIMPLANDRDKLTQVLWGIRDFEYRFKRRPEGMWLPETAVDVQTLEILAEQDIKFTILAPAQARRFKALGDRKWIDVSEGTIDTQFPYVCPLPSGKKINLFFYNGAIANEVAFGDLLRNGVNFANRLVGEFPEHQRQSRLVHIANDGETYGHHHSFGNMALAYMLYHVELNQMVQLTVYGEFLEKFPPMHAVEINEDTSWSCFHGIERWRAHCGCRLEDRAQWNQEWRKYLRETLDWLRDELVPVFETELRQYCADPWRARDDYITVILDTSETNQQKFLNAIGVKDRPDERRRTLTLLEMQLYAMLMYTSCGWFFDDISGLEAVQILQYAARAMQLAREATGKDFEEEFLRRLSSAKSNISEMGNGRTIYQHYVKSAVKSGP